MSVIIRIPTQLRTLTGGAGQVELEAASVGEALKALDAAHPIRIGTFVCRAATFRTVSVRSTMTFPFLTQCRARCG